MIEKSAIFSPCRKYRFVLERHWKRVNGYALFVCLNPSTADENIDDPTIRRCIRFADSWGYGGMVMCNIFSLRSTDPKALYHQSLIEPISENYQYIELYSRNAEVTIAAWGVHGKLMGRGKRVLRDILKNPHYLELTKHGYPKHPLYLKKTLTPRQFKVKP